MTHTHVLVYLNDHGHYGKPAFRVTVTNGKDAAFGDVDGDGDLDLYVQTGGTTPDQVFLNDGNGRRWTDGPKLASPKGGAGDTVVAIPGWKGTKRAAFLVNNGFQTARGARQLFEFTGG